MVTNAYVDMYKFQWPPPVNRQMLSKTLPSLAVSNDKKTSMSSSARAAHRSDLTVQGLYDLSVEKVIPLLFLVPS